MNFQRINGSVTTVAGAASVVFYLFNTEIRHIVITPTTATTSYDVTITDTLGTILVSETDRVGTLNDLTTIPAHGNLTMAITSASNDEVIKYYVSSKN